MSRTTETARAGSIVQQDTVGTVPGDAVDARTRDGPGRTRRRLDRLRPFAVAAALASVHLVLALLAFDPTPHTGGDSAGYIALARSLLERQEYVRLHDPALTPEAKYPPAFPALLALAMAVGIRSWVALKLVLVAVSGAAVALSYGWLRRWHSPGLALGAAAVLAVSPGVLDLSHWILSDVPFWAFTMLALWAFETWSRAQSVDAGEIRDSGLEAGAVAGQHGASADLEAGATVGQLGVQGRTAAVWLAAAIAATVVAYLTRSAGLPLLLAAASWLGLRRHWRALALFAVTALPLAALWWLRSQAAGADYMSELWLLNPYRPELGRAGVADLLARPVTNGGKYATLHLPILLFGRAHPLLLPVNVIVVGLCAIGWALRIRRPGVAELFLPLYAGLLLIWPAVWSGERFLLPALPLVLGYAGLALVRFARWADVRAIKPAAVAVVLVLLLFAVPGLAGAVRRGTACTRAYLAGEPYPCLTAPWQAFFRTAEWSRAAIPADGVVISRKPRLFFALSGRRGLIYPFSRDPAEFFAAAAGSGARYLVLDGLSVLTARYLSPAFIERPRAFCVMSAARPDRSAVLGIRLERLGHSPGGAASPARTIERCPDDFWRSPH